MEPASNQNDSFLTEIAEVEEVQDSDGEYSKSTPELPSFEALTVEVIKNRVEVLQEEAQKASKTANNISNQTRYYQDETGSEYDTDIEEEPPEKAVYDSSGKDTYLQLCKTMNMTPSSYITRHIKDPVLSLRHLSLGCKGTIAVTNALVTNTFIENLDMSDNKVGDAGAVSIANMLTENYFITELILSNNIIEKEGIAALCNVLSDHSYVKVLNLSGNYLKDDTAELIAEMLRRNYTLAKLDLGHNSFSCQGAGALCASLQTNDSLSECDLSWNNIRTKGSIVVAKMLATNMGLVSFLFSNNGLDKEGTKAIIKALKTNTSLVSLDLSNTRFDTAQMKDLGKALNVNTSLRILKLGRNIIKELDLEILLTALTTSSSLYILGLEDISVSKVLYERLCQLEKETGLVIHYGHSGGYQRSLPMLKNELLLDEFITTNINKLAPLFLNKDKEKTGLITIREFKECLKDAGLRLSENHLNWLLDMINSSNNEDLISCKDLISGSKSIPATLEDLRKTSTKRKNWNP